MSDKQLTREIQQEAQRTERMFQHYEKNFSGDKDLSTKIRRVREGASEVNKHITERIEK